MLTAIDFDDQSLFETHEVENEALKRNLPPKLEMSEPPAAKQSPHGYFGFGQLAAELFCKAADSLGGGSMVWCLRDEPLTRRLTS